MKKAIVLAAAVSLASVTGQATFADEKIKPVVTKSTQASLALTGLAGAAAVVGTIVIIGAVVASGSDGTSGT